MEVSWLISETWKKNGLKNTIASPETFFLSPDMLVYTGIQWASTKPTAMGVGLHQLNLLSLLQDPSVEALTEEVCLVGPHVKPHEG